MTSSSPNRLFYRSHGTSGAPVIILHGLLGMSDNWEAMGKHLGERFRVFVPDARNHGRSFHHPDCSYSAMANDLVQFMDAQGLEDAALIGHSMGGKTAMQCALSHPDRVARLIAIDIAPRAYAPFHDALLEATRHLALNEFKNREEIDTALRHALPNRAERELVGKNIGRNEHSAFFWKSNLPAIAAHYSEFLSAVEGPQPFEKPALFIKGGKSEAIAKSDEPDIRRLFPHSRIHTIREAGHWVHADAPEACLRAIMEFIHAH